MKRSRFWWLIASCVWSVAQLVGPSPLLAQNLVAVVVGDRSPAAGWGKYTANVAMDVTNIRGMLGDNMPEARLHAISLELEEDVDSDPKNVLAAISEIKLAPNDTLLFFYTGHGGSDDQGHYLALARGKLYRKTLLDALTSKAARLTVLITDSCNSRSDGYLFLAPAYRSANPAAPTALFRSLFLEPKGLVDINSCAPGESAFFTPLDEQMRELPGSVFTKALTSWVGKNRDRGRVWDELVREVSLQVLTDFHDYYPKGAQVAKGEPVQTQQTVYPIRYPGMPEKQGPRTGFVIRDFPGQGAVIISVQAGSPAAGVFIINQEAFTSLTPQQVIVSVNGQGVQNTDQVVQAIKASPQIVRLGIRDAKKGTFDVLLRMRY
jgi:hypothetical protein